MIARSHITHSIGVHLEGAPQLDAGDFEAHADGNGRHWITYHVGPGMTERISWHADGYRRIADWAEALRDCAINASLGELPAVRALPELGEYVRVCDGDQVRAEGQLARLHPLPSGRWAAIVDGCTWVVSRFDHQPSPSVTWDAAL